jgi:hypothetical protein
MGRGWITPFLFGYWIGQAIALRGVWSYSEDIADMKDRVRHFPMGPVIIFYANKADLGCCWGLCSGVDHSKGKRVV